MEILAAVARAPGAPFLLEKAELEPPRADEVLVRVEACGICHTDIVVRDATIPVPFPIVLGHEGAGVVEAVGEAVHRLAPGDRVAMSFDSCGACPSCQVGRPSYCHDFYRHNFHGGRTDGTTALSGAGAGEPLHGHFFGQSAFATHALCRERNAVKVTAPLAPELLAPLGCGVQTGAGAVINSLRVPAGASFAVFGTGSVGLSAIMAARMVGAGEIVAVDVNPARRAVAVELGATVVLDPSETDPVAAVRSATGFGVDFALDTTGRPDVIGAAVEALAPRGALGIVGASSATSELSVRQSLIRTYGRRIQGIVEGDADPHTFLPMLIAQHMRGVFPYDRLVTTYPFERINEAVADAEEGRVVKAVVTMG